MFRGTVLRSFVDRRTNRYHPHGSTYQSASLQRMEELSARGYIQFEPPRPEPAATSDAVPALQEMTMAQLKVYAAERGVALTWADQRNKAALIAAIQHHLGGE